jgi:hypothetical protein
MGIFIHNRPCMSLEFQWKAKGVELWITSCKSSDLLQLFILWGLIGLLMNKNLRLWITSFMLWFVHCTPPYKSPLSTYGLVNQWEESRWQVEVVEPNWVVYRRNWFAHGHKPEVMDELLFAWIRIHMKPLEMSPQGVVWPCVWHLWFDTYIVRIPHISFWREERGWQAIAVAVRHTPTWAVYEM